VGAWDLPQGTASGTYAPIVSGLTNAYTPNAQSLSSFRAKLAAAIEGTGLCQIVFGPGDSTTAGYGATRGTSDMATQMRNFLASQGYPTTGTGIVGPGMYTTDPRWVLDGTWSNNPSANVYTIYSYSSSSGGVATFTSDQPGSIVNVWYGTNEGPFTVAIDGAAPVTVTPAGGAAPWTLYQVTGLLNTCHQVVITTTSSTSVYILAAEVRNATGVTVSNFGVVGSLSLVWDSVAAASYTQALQSLPADLYFLNITINDFQNSVAVATHTSQITGIIGYLQANTTSSPEGASVVMVEPAAPSTASSFSPNYSAYVSADYAIAAAKGIPLIDLSARWVNYTTSNTNGLNFDTVHPNATGYADQASALGSLVMATQLPSVTRYVEPIWANIQNGLCTIPRIGQLDSAGFGASPATQIEHFTYFIADKTYSVGHIQFITGSVGGASTTYAAVGLYRVDGAQLTLVASCSNKTTFSGTYSTQSCALTASYTVQAGTLYAIGILQVGTTPASLMGTESFTQFTGLAQILAQTISGRSTLISSVNSGLTLTDLMVYYELLT